MKCSVIHPRSDSRNWPRSSECTGRLMGCGKQDFSSTSGILPLKKWNVNPSHAAIKISINATAAEFICKNIFPTPVQIKKL